MSYPKCVYHKDFDAENANEKSLKLHSRLVQNDEQLKKLGSDWGDHPSKKEVVEEVVEKKGKKKFSPGDGE